MFLRFGYNTNGFAHHRLEQTIPILAQLGYDCVAITLDHHALDPFDPQLRDQLFAVRRLLENVQLNCVIETGARFLLDPWKKHQPTLLSSSAEDRDRRLDFLRRAVDIAEYLGADAVSFWSGTPEDGAPESTLWERLVDGCRALCEHAERQGVRLAFEPEPGMFIDRLPRFAVLREKVDHPSFGLTLDVGHLHCQGEIPIADHLRQWRDLLWNVHIEDMRHGVHEHLMFGDGEIDFSPVVRTLDEIRYLGAACVELSRHSHDAVQTARKALGYLRALAP